MDFVSLSYAAQKKFPCNKIYPEKGIYISSGKIRIPDKIRALYKKGYE
jgi:hypothetical protein